MVWYLILMIFIDIDIDFLRTFDLIKVVVMYFPNYTQAVNLDARSVHNLWYYLHIW